MNIGMASMEELTGLQDVSSLQQTRLNPQQEGNKDDRPGELNQAPFVRSSPSRVDAQPSKPQGRAEKEALRKRKYHQRMKKERDGLRELAGELSEHLEELQGSSPAKRTIVNSAWRDCAVRLREERRRAEAEQIQLLATAKAQASFIQSLCENLPGDSEATVFRSQLRRVEACYA
jgi:hypothetical protein